MYSYDEWMMDAYFARVDAGELIYLPMDAIMDDSDDPDTESELEQLDQVEKSTTDARHLKRLRRKP